MRTTLTILIVWLSLVVMLRYCRGGEIPYDQAYADAQQGKPLVVLIGAEWCPGCRVLRARMKLLPRQFFHLDIDKATPIERGYFLRRGPIPQVRVFMFNGKKWTVQEER